MSDVEPAAPSLRVLPSERGAPEPSGWEAVYSATVVPVYRYVYARVGNRPDAEDLTTQVFMRALPRLRLGAPEEEIRGYLFATARTVLADHWRDAFDAPVAALPEDLAYAPPPPADEEAGVRRAGAILERLPERYRRVLELRFLRGYSLRETGAALGITAGNAKVIQHRALRKAAEVAEEM
ncbi:MAG TPA: sigma-70 family RNA polymerase sigma factor [Candidatus Dormibacteraeota bacterium]|nr:sigma-70 family RNA polymerase sigma factor [Candidatus Dormibacteraeota bacterium]